MKARISEIFQSIQGEGPYLGQSQVFIRFYGCNLANCKFCDTQLNSFREFETRDLLNDLKKYHWDIHSIALTGGEPLVQVDFLKDFLPQAKQRGFKIYLETNATLPEALAEVIAYVDTIAADFKLPSSTGLGDFWQEHQAFMNIAANSDVFVKAVICNTTELADIEKAIKILSGLGRNIPFILQPNTPEFKWGLVNKIGEFQRYARQFLADVRMIPQMHKLAGIK